MSGILDSGPLWTVSSSVGVSRVSSVGLSECRGCRSVRVSADQSVGGVVRVSAHAAARAFKALDGVA